MENVSLFVYRDSSANGVFDAGDQPLAHIAVRLGRPQGDFLVRRSNQFGFANFVNSLAIPGVDIDSEGKYEFEVLVPRGWFVSTGNALQTLPFRAAPGSRPGIVADALPAHVGLARNSTLEGRVAQRQSRNRLLAADEVKLSVVSSAGLVHKLVSDQEGRFSAELAPGAWTLRIRDRKGSQDLERELHMGNAPVRVSALILDDPARCRSVEHVTVDLEGVSGARRIAKMPTGPHGLEWKNLVVVQNDAYLGAGYINNTVSGRYVAYNSSGYPVTIKRAESFDFLGAWFGVSWPEAEGEILEVRAWRGESLVGEEALELSALGPFWFDADYRGIHRLELATRHYWQFVMDDPVFGFPEFGCR